VIPVDDIGMSAKPLLTMIQIVQGALADGAQTDTVERVDAQDVTAASAQLRTEC
jgi:hypothetical protein